MSSEWSIVDKVCIVTGANSGIGRETALKLIRMGARRVIIACRNMETGQEAVDYIKKEAELSDSDCEKKLALRKLDLSSMKSVREFAKDINENESELHCLIENAGVWAPSKKTLTEDGFELAFGTNHIGHFLLVKLLLDLLKKSAPSRIVVVASEAYKACLPFGLNLDNLNLEKSWWYSQNTSYAQSKLCNILFVRELNRQLQDTGVSCFSLHPGVIQTKLLRNQAGLLQWVFEKLHNWGIVPHACSVEDGIKTTINCATKPGIENLSGQYFSQIT